MKHDTKTLAVFTSVTHKLIDGKLYGYAPYVNEMNLWLAHFNKVLIIGTYIDDQNLSALDAYYEHNKIEFLRVPIFNVKSFRAVMGLIIKLPFVLMTIGRAMSKADYFHLRSPSNISALAAIVQILFPSKPKSVKYAGNWSPNMQLPRGYRLQKWVYTNPLITKNTKVLVYGQWPNQPKSVIPFIQATFKNEDRVSQIQRDYSERLIFTFVGAMVPGKRPIFAVRIIQSLLKSGVQAELHMYGDGILLDEVKSLLEREELKAHVMVYGNRHITEIRNAFKTSHFAILPSLSEGWPKAIAEGMFFGAIPIAHQVSCVPWMLGNGKRGVLIDKDLNKAVDAIEHCLAKDDIELNKMSSRAMKWSQQFTMEKLNDEISKVINT